MKPIFDTEKRFLEEKLGVILPQKCWRDGASIYLNTDSIRPLIKFKVRDKQIIITKNILKNINGKTIEVEYKKGKNILIEQEINKTWEEEYYEKESYILALETESIEKTKECIANYPDNEIRKNESGGKDSLLTNVIVDKSLLELNKNPNNYDIDFFNTTNETAQTYLKVKNYNKGKKLNIHNPVKGWYQWLKEDKNYFLPSIFVRNCCSTFKENRARQVLDKKKSYVIFLGMRKFESKKRANYDWYLNDAILQQGKNSLNVPKIWIRFLPIVNWKDEDVWLYILHNKLDYNIMYEWGFGRVGCLICPNQDDYIDLLTQKYYPLLWSRWEFALEKNYEITDVKNRLKWTLEEWENGKWKLGISKEQGIIQNKPTKERVKELAEIKGISEELALKYFQKKCSCDKKLNPDEIAMNLKVYGREMDILKMQCKDCFCKTNNITGKEYQDKVHDFRNQGCNLF